MRVYIDMPSQYSTLVTEAAKKKDPPKGSSEEISLSEDELEDLDSVWKDIADGVKKGRKKRKIAELVKS